MTPLFASLAFLCGAEPTKPFFLFVQTFFPHRALTLTVRRYDAFVDVISEVHSRLLPNIVVWSLSVTFSFPRKSLMVSPHHHFRFYSLGETDSLFFFSPTRSPHRFKKDLLCSFPPAIQFFSSSRVLAIECQWIPWRED